MSIRGVHSPMLNAAARLCSSLKRQGVVSSAREVLRRLRYARALKKNGKGILPPAIPALQVCPWVDRLPEIVRSSMRVTRSDLESFISQTRYPRHYYRAARRVEYALWHLVGLRLAGLSREDVVLDVGAQSGTWGKVVRQLVGCRVIEIDRAYRPGVHRDRIGASVGGIPLPDESISCMASFCAFNCLMGDADSGLIVDARRLLKPGGRLIVVPMCIGDEYVNLFDPLICCEDQCDAAARRFPWPGWGNGFGRWYDRPAFERRVLQIAAPMTTTLVDVSADNIDPDIPGRFFAAVFQK